ncbi:MgtC/SapB family protein [Streptomyces marispadix]|uniref:MgtC/SapB family protein n=1 Tax=Streptomyces marispadix TaxID=2922868 RepID=UPI0027E2E8CC|nr:MgtC/SapB family protein [Streptomyces marispadix]
MSSTQSLVTFVEDLLQLNSGQGLHELSELCLALLLSTLIGWERGARQKSAGLRTHALVGVASALMMQISQFGFGDVVSLPDVRLDPSRVAGQIITSIGFIGGGLIFVRRDAVRGLTTAATIWLTCAVGMACGGGLPVLASSVTALHFIVVRGYPLLATRLSAAPTAEQWEVRLRYRVGLGVLPELMELCTERGFRILRVRVDKPSKSEQNEADETFARVSLNLAGTADVNELTSEMVHTDGVLGVEVTAEPDRDRQPGRPALYAQRRVGGGGKSMGRIVQPRRPVNCAAVRGKRQRRGRRRLAPWW